MSSFNKVILMGNLTRDPELRSTSGGTHVADVSLAMNESWQDKDKTTQERVTFVDVTFWGKQAETLARWKKKGDPLMIEGRLTMDEWTDKESGKKRQRLKVTGTGFTFLGKGESGGNGEKPARKPERKPAHDEQGYDDYATSLPADGKQDPDF